MGFSDPAGPETVTVTGSVVTEAGSVTTAQPGSVATVSGAVNATTQAGSVVTASTTAEASQTAAAVVRGELPPNVPFARAANRINYSYVSIINGSTAADVLPATVNRIYILRTIMATCNAVGVVTVHIQEQTAAGATVRTCALAIMDLSKQAFLFPYGLMAIGAGNKLVYLAGGQAAGSVTYVTVNVDIVDL